MSRGLAIRLRGVVKRYGAITAVDGLDLDVPEGTCVGLLGPNGAGKSTTMKLLTAQAIADEGELEVLGLRAARRLEGGARGVRRRAAARQPRRDADGRAEPARLRPPLPHPARERRAAIERALEIANLRDRRDTRVDKLSGGMRRRLLIARALVHRPRLILLDEPTVGLDPQVRQELWALIDGLRSEGTSILMSTHYIEEAERLADTVTIMSHGRAVAVGPPADARAPSTRARGGRGLRAAGAAGRGRGAARARGAAHAPHGHEHLGRSAQRRRRSTGERRPANLEDVFVLLTGEEIA